LILHISVPTYLETLASDDTEIAKLGYKLKNADKFEEAICCYTEAIVSREM
jgi:hypothetical protein